VYQEAKKIMQQSGLCKLKSGSKENNAAVWTLQAFNSQAEGY
jgi:hypothetical protein